MVQPCHDPRWLSDKLDKCGGTKTLWAILMITNPNELKFPGNALKSNIDTPKLLYLKGCLHFPKHQGILRKFVDSGGCDLGFFRLFERSSPGVHGSPG